VRLTLHENRAPTHALRAALDEIGSRYGLAPQTLFELKVAATEALTNALKGSASDNGVDVALHPSEEEIEIEVQNHGTFELSHPAREELEAEGGRGIPLMLALVDEVEFSSGRSGTRVRMRKRTGGQRPSPLPA
jgi:anti-sigma regulatory factor (Ser/Thr protein kinase)